MTLDQLRIFVAVAERQHMRQAAEALNMVQSAVSHAVGTLEAEFGITLFDRIGRGVALNRAGVLFLDEARAVLARAETARGRLAGLAGPGRGTLLVHASQTIAGYWLPSRLGSFRRLYPAVAVRLLIGNTGAVARSIGDGLADLGFVEGDVADHPQLQAAVVAQDQLVLVVAPAHPWAGLAAIEPAMLAQTGWVLREPGSGTRSAFEAALRAIPSAPARLPVVMELPSNEAVRAAAEAGLGAAALSASVAASGIEAGLLRRVPFALPPRAFAMVRHRQRLLSGNAEAFWSMLRQDG